MQPDKRYRARIRLGVTTDTYDAEGTVQQERDPAAIQLADVERVLSGFLGEIDQIPPMYSAIKQGGHKLYDLARAGQEVERQPRRVRIDALTVQEWSPPEFVLDVTCRAGTYIRSLAYDLGEALGVGAFLSGLVRLSSGTFALEDAVALDELLTSADWQRYLISPRIALANWPSIQLDLQSLEHLRFGRAIEISAVMRVDTLFAYTPAGTLAAVLKPDDGLWRPDKVFL
jgi:tRNA pseudouridine55 synthase